MKRSNGDFAIGADTYAKKLAADEMIDSPLDQLLSIAEQDLKKNQAAPNLGRSYVNTTARRESFTAATLHAEVRC